MIPIVIDTESVKGLREYAESHRIPYPEMLDILDGRAPVAGDRPGHVLNLPVGFRLVYSIEQHPRKDGQGHLWLRHMSMSLAAKGREPGILTFRLLCELLGFPSINSCAIRRNPVDGVLEVLAEIPEGE